MSSSSLKQRQQMRRRASSVTKALNQIPLNHQEDAQQQPHSHVGRSTSTSSSSSSSEVKPLSGATRPRRKVKGSKVQDELPENYRSLGFLGDVRSGRWMLVPSSAFLLLLLPLLYSFNHYALVHFNVISPSTPNYAETLFLPSYRLPNGKYNRGPKDWLFLGYYIVFWSFVRQAMTLHVIRPLGKRLGVRKPGQLMRFTEQGFAVFYYGIMGCTGLWVMYGLPTWFYRTKYLWIDYPHDQMTLALKVYYLLQIAHWLQEFIILVLRIEKPRKDFPELVAHHIVTLWLVGWSYFFHLTLIGNAIYFSMDFSDIFLALAKCVNYVNEDASAPFLGFFFVIWCYLRHYQNFRILWSVWYEVDKYVPAIQRQWAPFSTPAYFLAPWIKDQMFLAISLLALINIYWSVLVLRIIYRAVVLKTIKDERSDDEDEGEEEHDKVEAEDKDVAPSTGEKVQSLGLKVE